MPWTSESTHTNAVEEQADEVGDHVDDIIRCVLSDEARCDDGTRGEDKTSRYRSTQTVLRHPHPTTALSP